MSSTFTPTTNAVAIPTVVAQETIRLLPSYMGLAKFISKDTDWSGKDFQTYGVTLDITKPGALVKNDKVPGSPYVPQNATATKVSVTLDKNPYVMILQEDVTKMLQKPDLQLAYAQRQAIVLAESIESAIFALHPSLTNTITFDYTSEATIDASYRALRSRFARLKVPKMEEKMLFADTSLIDKLLSVTKYTSGDYVTNPSIVEGAVNRIHGINNFETQLAPATGSPVAYHNLATTKWGFVIASRPMPLDGNGRGAIQSNIVDPTTGLTFRVTEAYDTLNGGVIFNLECLYGVGIADANQVVEVESF